jgi:uncharacterized protein with ATP-grasp and redox domains
VKSAPPCIPCILGQVLVAAREVTQDEWLHRKVLEEVMASLPGTDWSRSPAEFLTEVLGVARKTLRAQDAFAARRRDVLHTMSELAAEVRAEVATARDPLAVATVAAAAANVVDALALGPVDLATAFRERRARGFAQGSVDDLRSALTSATSILYVLDNAGEAALDAILVELLVREGKLVIVAARRPGLFHDATVDDAISAGLKGTVIDTGQDGLLGAAPVLCGAEFRSAFDAAELVIGKGSACYETLTGERKETVFLLHAKCEPVARALGVAPGDLVLLKS